MLGMIVGLKFIGSYERVSRYFAPKTLALKKLKI